MSLFAVLTTRPCPLLNILKSVVETQGNHHEAQPFRSSGAKHINAQYALPIFQSNRQCLKIISGRWLGRETLDVRFSLSIATAMHSAPAQHPTAGPQRHHPGALVQYAG